MKMQLPCAFCLLIGLRGAAAAMVHHSAPAQPHDFAAAVAGPAKGFLEITPPVFVAHGFMVHKSSAISGIAELGSRRHVIDSKEAAAIKDKCNEVCGKGVDTSCAVECQVKIYGCYDYDRKTKEGAVKFKKCEEEVYEVYSGFAEDWEKTHPYTQDLLLRSQGQVTVVDLEYLHDECQKACGKGVDSSCVPECQVKLYACIDHDKKDTRDVCEKKVLDKYRDFAADWDKTHPYLLAVGGRATTKDLLAIRDQCNADCGSVGKKSCSPRCQTATYKCLVNVHDAAGAVKYKSCVAEARSEVARAEATSLSNPTALVTLEKSCVTACGLDIDASCVPECEMKMYSCVGSKEYAKCTSNVAQTYEKLASGWKAAHPNLLAAHGTLSFRGVSSSEALEEAKDSCAEACGVGVDSSCKVECQVKMYSCLDHDRKTEEGAKKYKECTVKVLTEYEKFSDKWDATHPYLLAIHRHVQAVELLRAKDKCKQACGKGVDTSCVPQCQVEMYQCLDHDRKTTEGAKKYDECEKNVVAVYEKFGADWEAKHPY